MAESFGSRIERICSAYESEHNNPVLLFTSLKDEDAREFRSKLTSTARDIESAGVPRTSVR